jgi:hypothetical protein
MLFKGFYWKINFSEDFTTCRTCKLFLFQDTKPSAGSNNILYATTFACQQEITKHWSCNLEGIWGPCQGREPMEPWKLLLQYRRTNITKTQMSGRKLTCKVQLSVWKKYNAKSTPILWWQELIVHVPCPSKHHIISISKAAEGVVMRDL